MAEPKITDQRQVSQTTMGAAPSEPALAAPAVAAITLPTGGGAIRGISETFAANPVTGTGSLSVPVATSPGRSGFGPQLALSYDSGAGNGPYGFGWTLSPPAIHRKTDRGVPRYYDGEDTDAFVLHGADELVPDVGPPPDPVTWGGRTYKRRRLRPRTEGAYARIEHWTNDADPGDSLWRVVSKDNVSAWYGLDSQSRIADPGDARRTFEWLLCETYDDTGNVVAYSYKAEDSAGVDTTAAHERNRTSADRSTNRYLKRICYGNRAPYYPTLDDRQRDPLPASWLFEVVFDYGEHDDPAPTPNEDRNWIPRPDPFSRYRAGFEIRSYRRCRRVLMFHHFPGVPGVGVDCLVRSTDFTYADEQAPVETHSAGYSLLRTITSTGYMRDGAAYRAKSLPPLELTYSTARIDERVRELSPDARTGLPEGVDGRRYRWADLDGDGVAGTLSEQDGAWYYARNRSPASAPPDTERASVATFAPAAALESRPSLARLDQHTLLADLAGDGRVDLVELGGPLPGFHERSDSHGWGPFVPFEMLPNVAWRSAGLRLVDLTGDGLPDLLIGEDDALVWYPSHGEQGFGDHQRVTQVLDEERGPRVVFSGERESLVLADLSGDGLVDLVRVRCSEVCYWPNLGYGRFGAKITMDASPVLCAPEEFDPRRVLLADIDGSGTSDLIYLASDGVRLYFNRSGNGWSPSRLLSALGPINDPQTVTATDLLGNGTACLVLSSPLPADVGWPLSYVDLMADGKPHLLTTVLNNVGGETRVRYVSSTRFAQADEGAGRPWITRLPFPVHVVERVELIDHVAGTRYVTRYAYHHGYYDGVEREFRGFAMIERHDSDVFDADGVPGAGAGQDLSAEHHQPPVTTYTWFHTGEERSLAHEYHGEHALLGEALLPDNLAPDERAGCLRALRGAPVHQEIYSYDSSSKALEPYTISEHRYAVRRVQPRAANRHAVYAVDGLESLTESRERDPSDPRVTHAVNLEVDRYGHAVKTAAISYGRKQADATLPPEVRAAQERLTISYVEVDHTPDLDVEGLRPSYRLRVPFEIRSYEVTGLAPGHGYFGVGELRTQIAATAPIGYEVVADGSKQRRLLSNQRILFRDNSLAPRPLGQWDTLGLSFESYTLAHTQGTLAAYPSGSVSAAELGAAGYVELDGDGRWWAPSGTLVFGAVPADHFYMPVGARDPLGLETRQTFDSFDLLVEGVSVVQAAWSRTLARNDYRVLGPVEKTDPNGSRSVVELNELGMVTKQVSMGKVGSHDGDTLADPTARLEYDLDAWRLHGTPCSVRVRAREEHRDPATRWLERVVYADGHGGVALVKERVGPGLALRVNPDGTTTEIQADPRWRGTGRTVRTNKGLPIRRYDPYFSPTDDYEDQDAVRSIGVSALQYYDPAGRNIRTTFPEGTFTRTVYGAWSQQAFDVNDTVQESNWYSDRGSPDPSIEPEPVADPQRRAAWLAAKHADTPGTTHFDVHGRAIYAVSDYGGGTTAAVRLESDYDGRFTTLFDQRGRAISGGFTGLGGRAQSMATAPRRVGASRSSMCSARWYAASTSTAASCVPSMTSCTGRSASTRVSRPAQSCCSAMSFTVIAILRRGLATCWAHRTSCSIRRGWCASTRSTSAATRPRSIARWRASTRRRWTGRRSLWRRPSGRPWPPPRRCSRPRSSQSALASTRSVGRRA